MQTTPWISGLKADNLFWLLRGILDVTVWGGALVRDADLPLEGAAVFVANHAGPIGPIGAVCSLPVRLHPWIIGEMLHRDRAAAYLQKDFVRPALRLPDALAGPVSSALTRVTVPLLRHLGCVPVWHDRELMETYRISSDLLAAGRDLLIFPEDPDMPIDGRTSLRPFKSGFAHLGRLYFERTGASLRFYPVAVHQRQRRVELAPPVCYNPGNPDPAERRRVTRLLESVIAAMLSQDPGAVGLGVQQTR